MHVVRFVEAPGYEAPGHHDLTWFGSRGGRLVLRKRFGSAFR